MKHARAVLEATFPVTQYAGKQIVRIPDGKGGVRMMARSEDLLHGCFDALAVGPYVLAVQVTSQTEKRNTVADRKRKIEREFLKWFPPRSEPPLVVQIWSWVNRTGFRVWTWHHPGREWIEANEILRSPELKSRAGSA